MLNGVVWVKNMEIKKIKSNENAKGFSLLELIIVMVIMMILAGVTVFALRGNKESYKTDDQALQILDFLQEARFRALSQREIMRVEINRVTNQVRIIDENSPLVADDDTVVRTLLIAVDSDVKLSSRPTTVTTNPPSLLSCPDVVFAPSLHPTSQAQSVATFRFNLLGQVLNAGVNDTGQNAVMTSSTLFLWPPNPTNPSIPAQPGLVRAITILGTTGAMQLWKYNGTTFVK
jgi:prepilin-type N-terminal cleavage/methylation domain-containing protein